MLAALKGGQLDSADTVPPTLAKQWSEEPGFTLQIGDSSFLYDMPINSNKGKRKHRELLDPKVKQALNMAVDRQQIIDTVLAGYGVPSATLLTPLSAPYMNTDIKPPAYDLAAANKILDDAGYKRGADGIRVGPDGSKMYGTEFMGMGIDEVTPAASQVGPRLAVMDEMGIWAQIVYPNAVGFGGQERLDACGTAEVEAGGAVGGLIDAHGPVRLHDVGGLAQAAVRLDADHRIAAAGIVGDQQEFSRRIGNDVTGNGAP